MLLYGKKTVDSRFAHTELTPKHSYFLTVSSNNQDIHAQSVNISQGLISAICIQFGRTFQHITNALYFNCKHTQTVNPHLVQ